MPKRSLVPDVVEQYVSHVITPESPLQQRLRAETGRLPQAGMQIGPDQGRLLALLVHLIGARRALEVGTFTGYSALAVAAALRQKMANSSPVTSVPSGPASPGGTGTRRECPGALSCVWDQPATR